MILSLLATSIDGFVCGFIIGSMGIKFSMNDFIKSFFIIFICCTTAAVTGNILAQTQLHIYINILGAVLMLVLAFNSLTSDVYKTHHIRQVPALAISVAADASIVSLYLAMCGYSIVTVSFTAALMHSVLIWAGDEISIRLIKEEWLKYTKYISAIIFLTMALHKISGIME